MTCTTVDYGVIHKRATKLAGMARGRGVWLEADDLTQQVFLRFHELGLDKEVDPAKGSSVTLLHGVMSFVFLEMLRREARWNRRAEAAAMLSASLEDPSERARHREGLAWLESRFRLLSDRVRASHCRQYCLLFGEAGDGPALPRDHVATCRTRRTLREEARRLGLI